ncbi:hypothetical protein GQ600_15442 [Phytophthora cactorum]|nr:hypothetical protein GQ600_15442 [Phytophthora cactorum]
MITRLKAVLVAGVDTLHTRRDRKAPQHALSADDIDFFRATCLEWNVEDGFPCSHQDPVNTWLARACIKGSVGEIQAKSRGSVASRYCGVMISRRSLTTISEQGQDYRQVAQVTNPRSCDRKRPRGARDSTRSLPKTCRCSIMAKMSFKAGFLIINNGTGRIRIQRTRTDGHGTKTRRPMGATFEKARQRLNARHGSGRVIEL